MQTQQTVTLFGTVSNSATSRISKNGRKYTAFGVAIISDHNLQAFHYNVVAFGKQGHFAKPLQTGTRIKLVVQAQSQPDNIATLPLLTATFVRPVRPVAWGYTEEGECRYPANRDSHVYFACEEEFGETVEKGRIPLVVMASDSLGGNQNHSTRAERRVFCCSLAHLFAPP